MMMIKEATATPPPEFHTTGGPQSLPPEIPLTPAPIPQTYTAVKAPAPVQMIKQATATPPPKFHTTGGPQSLPPKIIPLQPPPAPILHTISAPNPAGLDNYTVMKNAIIARIKADETIPLRPDIQKLYYLKPLRAPGGCSYPGAGESCWTSKFQEFYDELKKEAGVTLVSENTEKPVAVKMKVTPNTSVGSSCGSRHFNREEYREECYRRQKAGKKRTMKSSKNYKKRKTSRRRR
jgi:hypothetical protein